MKILPIFLFIIISFAKISAQQDSIFIEAKISENKKYISVKQEITYYNHLDINLNKIKLLNWISSYKNKKTSLVYRRLEDRKDDLHFAKNDDLGALENLSIKIDSSEFILQERERENIYIPLKKELKKGESVKLELKYTLKLPNDKFTGYGMSENALHLKYFFIVPDSFETPMQEEKNYINIEEVQNYNTYWNVIFEIPGNFYSKSNLIETFPNCFSGTLKTDPEFIISKDNFPEISTTIDDKKVDIQFGYHLTPVEKEYLEFYLPLHLKFIKNITGLLPEKIFISEKFKNDEDFIGNDDVKFWKFNYKMFTNYEVIDLDYFSIISKNILKQSIIYNPNEDHWIINGTKTYLEIEYLKRFYNNRKLLGDLPENFNIWGIKPLKWFYASKLKLSERYGLGYLYIQSENLDQKIDEKYNRLSNFNKTAISNFEMGSLLNFTAEKMGNNLFEDFLKNYIQKYENTKIDKNDFIDQLTIASGYSSAYIEYFIKNKQRINFSLKNYKKTDDNFQVKISKNTDDKIPFKIETKDENGIDKTFWFDTNTSKKQLYNIPQSNASKILVNSDYIFPESNQRDNYLYTKGFFANKKKIRLKFFKDIPNPEFNEIYINPKLNFNAYDGLLLGLNFRNTSMIRQKFAYSLTPYYSTNTNDFTGSGAVSYTFMPPDTFFRALQFGVSGSYFHYDYHLFYKKISAFAGFNFTKNPRSDIGRSLSLSYNYYERDLTPQMILNNYYGKYNLWNINYNYFDQKKIHENYIGGGIQWMEDFQKISTEAFYRYEYAQNKKMSFRFFGGYFISNNTKNSLFNFGVSRVSNYAFSYGLIGQSATSGILSQQLILAEGGFKSFLAPSVNQWITTLNMDTKLWKWFNIYGDAGVFKNKGKEAEFIWDTGIKVAVFPDFLELYFPIQSTLGFEPSFKDYGSRIRFTLMLNFNALINYFRKGVF